VRNLVTLKTEIPSGLAATVKPHSRHVLVGLSGLAPTWASHVETTSPAIAALNRGQDIAKRQRIKASSGGSKKVRLPCASSLEG
jgi:hypothetical protein